MINKKSREEIKLMRQAGNIVALVHQDDLGRVIGKKGRVAGAIRTLAHAAAIRNKETVEIEFNGSEE